MSSQDIIRSYMMILTPCSDAQVQSVVEEVQNIIGQVRELGMQVREQGDRQRRAEADTNNTTERFGVELAGAISRVETVSVGHIQPCPDNIDHLD